MGPQATRELVHISDVRSQARAAGQYSFTPLGAAGVGGLGGGSLEHRRPRLWLGSGFALLSLCFRSGFALVRLWFRSG